MQNPRSRSEGVSIYVERARTGIEKARFSKKDWRLSVSFGFYGIKSNRYFRSYIQQPCFFVLRVADDDTGMVIGRKGRIARAIRSLMKAAGNTEGKKVNVEIE